MRKIAREAVIFALLGALVASVWFLIQETESFRRAEAERAQSDVRDAAASDDPAFKILFNAQNAEHEIRTEAWRIFWESKDMKEFTRHLDPLNLPQPVKTDLRNAKNQCFPDFIPVKAWDKYGNPVLPAGLVPIYCDKIPSPPAGYHLDFPDSLRWPQLHATRLQVLMHSVPPALFTGLIVGFPGGLGVWLFYRLVRFAIQG
jgi:hypothetical protein